MPRWLMWESAACCKIACCSAWPVFPWVHLCTAVREASKLELTVMQNTSQGVLEAFAQSQHGRLARVLSCVASTTFCFDMQHQRCCWGRAAQTSLTYTRLEWCCGESGPLQMVTDSLI